MSFDICCSLLTQIDIYICVKNIMTKHAQSIVNKMINCIYGHGRGWVFYPCPFFRHWEP
jgi:hypothetical protein